MEGDAGRARRPEVLDQPGTPVHGKQRRASLSPVARALVLDRSEGRHHPLARDVLAPVRLPAMIETRRSVVQRTEGGAHDRCRKPVAGIGNAVLEDLGGSVPGKCFQALVCPCHVRHELFRQMPWKQMAEFLAQGNKMAFGKGGGAIGIHPS